MSYQSHGTACSRQEPRSRVANLETTTIDHLEVVRDEWVTGDSHILQGIYW